MQISLTKKLAAVMEIKPSDTDESINPLFCWTANWTNTFENHKEDMVVMANQATRFTVTIYGVKHNQFKDISAKIIAAIQHTLLAMNLDPELVGEYIRLSGEITYAANHDRKLTAHVNRRGLDAAFVVGDAVNESEGKLKFEDTLGSSLSKWPVNCSNNSDDGFIPSQKMIESLTELTGKPAYNYCAFELLVTLDLGIYKAIRRLIVSADMEFQKLHKVLQRTFNWENRHLYDFTFFDENSTNPCTRLVTCEEGLVFDKTAVLIDGQNLSEYLPKYKRIMYAYDMGDYWEHEIELVRIIDKHNAESPYLLESIGQAPPEDVGGVSGFIDFREIMLNHNHPDYASTKEWARYWSPELSKWQSRPRVID